MQAWFGQIRHNGTITEFVFVFFFLPFRLVFAAPICLPEKNEDFLGKFGWAAGWGALNPGSRLRPKTLQAVDVPVIENRLYIVFTRSIELDALEIDEF